MAFDLLLLMNRALKLNAASGKIVTAVSIFYLASLLWPCLDANPPSFVYIMIGAAIAAIVVLLVVYTGILVFSGKHRNSRLIIHFVILAALLSAMPSLAKISGNTQRLWFLRSGQHIYGLMVDKIKLNKTILTGVSHPLDIIVARPYVYGRTNIDGSITIWFQGRGNWLRSGYLYNNGNQISGHPGDANLFYLLDNPQKYYLHITNEWYEY
jgi:hypothetical protein